MSHSFALRCVPFLALSIVAVAACVGDDPTLAASDADAGGSSGSSGSSGTSGTSGAPTCKGDTVEACGATCTACSAPKDGAVACVAGACQKTCSTPQTLCGDACVDTTASAAHCGKCDHACGAAQCSGSVCQPFVAASGFTSVHAIAMSPSGVVISADSDVTVCTNPAGCTPATLTTIKAGLSQLNDVTVSGTNVYFDANMGDFEIVYRCPVGGCPAGGPDVIENVVNDSIGRVVAGPTDVLWTRYQSYYGPYSRRCALPGCAAPVDVRTKMATGPYYDLVTRETSVPSKVVSVGAISTLWATGGLYNDGNKALRSCALASTCATPSEVTTAYGNIAALTYYSGKHYGAQATTSGTIVFSVSDATPTTTTTLVADAAGTADVAVDASGIYWVNGATGKVHRCATLAGCSGGGETLATGQVGAMRIALDPKFVYWSTPTSVMKVAK